MDVKLVTKLLTGALSDEPEHDLPALSNFCPDVLNITALEWLALLSFLSSSSFDITGFRPSRRYNPEIERDAVRIAARILLRWPQIAFEELSTCWQHNKLTARQSPMISLRQLRLHPPIRHAVSLRDGMQLPKFVCDAIGSYMRALTIHSEGLGLAVNPDWLVFTGDDIPKLRVDAPVDGHGETSDSLRLNAVVSLSDRISELRQADIALHEFWVVERMIHATDFQRRLLQQRGFLRPLQGSRVITSIEIYKFGAWIRQTASTRLPSFALIPLSALSRWGGFLLERVIAAVQSRTIQLFRSSLECTRLDQCFIDERSLGSLSGDR